MKEILEALRPIITAGLPEIKGVHILADADILPPAVRFPCVGLKDGESSYSEGMAETEDEKGSVLIYVYQQILKQEASVMGDSTQKGILEFIITLRLLLNFNHLDGLVHHAYCPDTFASETMFAGENVFVQRKGIRYIYEIDPEATLTQPDLEFFPADVPGYLIDFDSMLGITKNSENKIGSWAGPNDITLAVGPDDQKPVWMPNEINGLALIRFDGINDYLQADFAWARPNVIYIILKLLKTRQHLTDYFFAGGSTFTGGNPGLGYEPNGDSSKISIQPLYAGAKVVHPGLNIPMIVRCEMGPHDPPGSYGISKIRINNGSETTGSAYGWDMDGLTLAREGGYDGFYSNIDIARIVGFNQIPNAENDQKIMDYLNKRYQIY